MSASPKAVLAKTRSAYQRDRIAQARHALPRFAQFEFQHDDSPDDVAGYPEKRGVPITLVSIAGSRRAFQLL